MFLITGIFERFKYFNFETNFLKNENLFQKNWGTAFKLKVLRLKAQYLYTKLPFQKPKANRMGSTKWTITKNDVLQVTTLFIWKFCFSFRTSYKELIWCTSYPNVHLHIILSVSAGVLFDDALLCEYP